MSLNFHAQDIINNLFDLAPSKNASETQAAKRAVEKCVAKWSTRNSNTLRDIFYQIGQLFLFVFGCSDWQKAKRASFKAITKNYGIGKEMVPHSFALMMIKVADKALEIIVMVNDRDLPKTQSPMSDAIFQAEMARDLPKFFQELKNDLKATPWNDAGLLKKAGIDLNDVVANIIPVIKKVIVQNQSL